MQGSALRDHRFVGHFGGAFVFLQMGEGGESLKLGTYPVKGPPTDLAPLRRGALFVGTMRIGAHVRAVGANRGRCSPSI
jgi:hypothetical protein